MAKRKRRVFKDTHKENGKILYFTDTKEGKWGIEAKSLSEAKELAKVIQGRNTRAA